MNNYKKILIVLFCIISFLITGNVTAVSIDSRDATLAVTGSGDRLNSGFADSALKGTRSLKFDEELKDMTFDAQQSFKSGEFTESATALLTGLFLIGISIIGKNNSIKKESKTN